MRSTANAGCAASCLRCTEAPDVCQQCVFPLALQPDGGCGPVCPVGARLALRNGLECLAEAPSVSPTAPPPESSEPRLCLNGKENGSSGPCQCAPGCLLCPLASQQGTGSCLACQEGLYAFAGGCHSTCAAFPSTVASGTTVFGRQCLVPLSAASSRRAVNLCANGFELGGAPCLCQGLAHCIACALYEDASATCTVCGDGAYLLAARCVDACTTIRGGSPLGTGRPLASVGIGCCKAPSRCWLAGLGLLFRAGFSGEAGRTCHIDPIACRDGLRTDTGGVCHCSEHCSSCSLTGLSQESQAIPPCLECTNSRYLLAGRCLDSCDGLSGAWVGPVRATRTSARDFALWSG
jgi:hypothetical protein